MYMNEKKFQKYLLNRNEHWFGSDRNLIFQYMMEGNYGIMNSK